MEAQDQDQSALSSIKEERESKEEHFNSRKGLNHISNHKQENHRN